MALISEKRNEISAAPKKVWRSIKLGEHLSFLKNGQQSRAQLSLTDPIRYLHYGDIHTSPQSFVDLRRTNFPRLAESDASRLSRLENGDVVFVDASEDLDGVGKSVEITGLDEVEAVAGQHTIAVRFSKEMLTDGFKGYLQNIPEFRRHLLRLTSGTKVYATSRSHIASAEIRLPPLPEQRAIAEALADVDAAIEAMTDLLAKKRDLRTAAMQQLLSGDTRLPGFTEPWVERPLGNHIRFQVGFPFRSEFFNRNGFGIRLIRNRDLNSNDDPIFFDGSFDDYYRVEDGDLLVSMDGEFSVAIWSGGRALLNQRVGRIFANGTVDTRFLSLALIKPLREIERRTSSTTVKHLSHKDVERMRVKLPALEEQKAIASVIFEMSAELNALEDRLAKTTFLKQGMMQALLTGRVRLPVAESEPSAQEPAYA